MSQPVSTRQLPARCLVVWPQGWTWVLELRVKQQVQQQAWCKSFDELAQRIQATEVAHLMHRLEPPPTYLLDGPTQTCRPLSYDEALAYSKQTT